jgi:hypothetical protein
MAFLIAFVVAALFGLIAGWLMHLRFRTTVFIRIKRHVGWCVFALFLAFFLFGIFGFNIWSITILPILSLVFLLLVVRNGIEKLLEVK